MTGFGRGLCVTGIGIVARDTLDPDGRRPGEDWFDHRSELGRGYKYLPRSSQYALAATKRALADAGEPLDGVPEDRRGIAVGTNNGVSAFHGEIDRTINTHGSTLLSPAGVPYFSINLVGSRVAMEYSLRGFSLGTHSPRVAGLESLQHGMRAIEAGRSALLLAGAAECPLDEDEADSVDCDDGAVMLVLTDSKGDPGYGRVQCRSFFLPPSVTRTGRAAETARGSVDDVLSGLGLSDPSQVQIRLVGDDSATVQVVESVLGPRTVRVPAMAGCLGATREVADALLIGRPSLIVAVAAEGNVAAAHIRPGANRGANRNV